MKQRYQQKITRWLILLVLCYSASTLAGKLYKRQVESSLVRLSALDSEPFPGLRENSDSLHDYHNISQSLLIDSILTIVQNYYVDTHRLTSRELLDRALYVLTENNDIRLYNLSEKRALISAEGGQIEITIPENYSYETLAKHAGEIARILNAPASHDISSEIEENRQHSYKSSRGAARFLNALLQSLDPHSSLLNREEYRDLRQGTEGSFGGLGVVVGIKDDLLTVIKPLPESPAFRAGIVQDDKIMSINDVVTFGSTLDHLVQHMRGAPGTTVRLSLLRDGEYAPVEVSLKREIIQVSSIEDKVLENDKARILHLTVESFSSRTSKEISRSISRHQSRKPLDALILDLRSNPGGLLDQAVQVADLFLSSGDIVSTVGRRREVERAYFDNRDVNLPLVVLINSETASASEIVAGALQDNNRAIIVGQPSFGKGSVQTVFELPGEKALKLTIARYYTPSGRSIQNIGIMPDIWLQPIWKNNTNVNLLGSDRYRNEQFSSRGFLRMEQPRELLKQNLQHSYKGYYLTSEDEKQGDFVLSFAERLVEDLLKQNERPVPVERLRASYWLANSHNMIRSTLAKYSSRAENWIAKKFQVDWRRTRKKPYVLNEQIIFTIQKDKEIEVIEGETLRIPWVIENKGQHRFERVSIFALPESYLLDTHEVLLGSIAPLETKSGVIELPINLSSAHHSFKITFGLAVDSWSQVSTIQKREILIKSKEHPAIGYEINLVGEKGGQINGILEPGEEALLELKITNTSKIVAHEVQPNLTNLTGKQVQLGGNKAASVPFVLKPNQHRVIRFPIKASDQLYHSKLYFGVTIDSHDLLRPIKGSFIVDGQAGFKTAKQSH